NFPSLSTTSGPWISPCAQSYSTLADCESTSIFTCGPPQSPTASRFVFWPPAETINTPSDNPKISRTLTRLCKYISNTSRRIVTKAERDTQQTTRNFPATHRVLADTYG